MITFISNWVLKRVCMLLTKREKNVTKTAYEIGNPNPNLNLNPNPDPNPNSNQHST